MARERKFTIVIAGDSTGGEKAISSVSGKMDGFASKMDGVANKVTGAVAGAFATDRIISFGEDMLSMSSQLAAIDTKVKTVFEGQQGSIREWADQNNEAFGLTDDKLAGLAANFGDLLKPMGFTAEQAAGMSKEVVGLSGALSAWSGGTIDTASAADKLAAAMLGEREGLKELGISIQQADVDARLAAKGQSELEGSAKQMAEAVATQELIFEKSTDAQKAWAAGGNQALRKQNEMKAAVGELQEKLATGLTPIILGVTNGLMSLGKWMGENQTLVLAVGIGITAALVPAFIAWAAAAIPAAAATLLAAAPVIALGIAVAGLAYLVITHWDTIKAATTAAKDWIVDKWNAVIDFFTGIPGRISDLAHGMWDGISEAFKGAVNTIIRGWNAIEFTIPGFSVGPVSWGGFTLGVPDIPQMHTGGVFTTSSSSGEGLALLKHGEGVFTPEQMAAMGSGGDHYHFHNHGVIGSQAEMDRWFLSSAERLGNGGKKLGPGGRKLVGATP